MADKGGKGGAGKGGKPTTAQKGGKFVIPGKDLQYTPPKGGNPKK